MISPLSAPNRRAGARLALACLGAGVLLGLGAYAGYASKLGASAPPRARLALSLRPASARLSAGDTARVAIRIARTGVFGRIVLGIAAPWPPHTRLRLSPRATRGSRATLTIITARSTPAATYRLRLTATAAGRTTVLPLLLVVNPARARGQTGAPTPFTITGDPAGPLRLGAPQPINLRLSNPNLAPLSVTNLGVSIVGIQAPAATPSLPCSAIDFTVQQLASPDPLTVPASSSRSLAELGIPPAGWPQLAIVDRPSDQDGCQGATVTLAYSARARAG
ncbi:MAG: hypothetical protein ACJ76X_06590 [Solirubrobacteraceae bacterium]